MCSSGALAKSGGKRACFSVLHGLIWKELVIYRMHVYNFDFGKIGGMDSVPQHTACWIFWRDVYCPSLERLAAFL